MSTRANIKIEDSYTTLWFYRHSDGYPSVTMDTLKTFIRWIDEGKIRNNVNQASGWLVLIGADEYSYNYDYKTNTKTRKENVLMPLDDWKCGSYEPTNQQHGDIEFLYTVNLEDRTLTIEHLGKRSKQYSFKEVVGNGFLVQIEGENNL